MFLIQCTDTFLQLQSGRITSTSNITCKVRLTDQIFFFFFLNKPHSCNLPPKGSQNALVVSCSTRTIKVDWKTSFYASYAWLSILPPAPSQLKGCEPRIRADSEELTNPGTLPLVPESSLCGGSSGLPAPFLSSLFPTTRCT